MDDATRTLSVKDGMDLYETGKHRRYGLLFSVNGGAFAVAKLLEGGADETGRVLGGLTLPWLSVGMALFTAVMVADLYAFGSGMRRELRASLGREVFGPVGRAVLVLIGLLLVGGWLLVGFGAPPGA